MPTALAVPCSPCHARHAIFAILVALLAVLQADVIGRIIGPGGSQIRDIRDRSGARVRVANDKEPGTEMRKITIWGTETQIQVCGVEHGAVV